MLIIRLVNRATMLKKFMLIKKKIWLILKFYNSYEKMISSLRKIMVWQLFLYQKTAMFYIIMDLNIQTTILIIYLPYAIKMPWHEKLIKNLTDQKHILKKIESNFCNF